MRELEAQVAVGAAWTIPEHIDDGGLRYALEGATVWAALALSRALVDEQLRPGDDRFDRLIAVQRELAALREGWS